jgi:hypothetical protein
MAQIPRPYTQTRSPDGVRIHPTLPNNDAVRSPTDPYLPLALSGREGRRSLEKTDQLVYEDREQADKERHLSGEGLEVGQLGGSPGQSLIRFRFSRTRFGQ